MPTGTIARLLIDKGFGFIRDEGGIEHFFHRSSVRGAVFELLREGQRVEFTPEDSQKGSARRRRASHRRLINAFSRPVAPHGPVCSPPPSVPTTIEASRKRTGPGGPPGLQNRSLPAHAGRLGSTPRRFRQASRQSVKRAQTAP